ncbi:MAG: ATP-dependent Clp protease proteolytic subunit [Patescibacteria group bacterium]
MASIPLVGKLTVQRARSLIIQLKEASLSSNVLYLQIKSHGGRLRAYAEIANAMLELSQKGVKFIGQADEVGSAAMLVYLNCDERWVRPGSGGFIHLPIPNNKKMSEESVTLERQKIVNFISERTGLSSEKIISLDNIPLLSNEMVVYRIATKKVPSFSLTPVEPV